MNISVPPTTRPALLSAVRPVLYFVAQRAVSWPLPRSTTTHTPVQEVVATGSFDNGVFDAREILARHDESYMPKEVLDGLKEQGVYVEPSK